MSRTILGALSVLVVLVLVYVLFKPEQFTSIERQGLSAGFQEWKSADLKSVAKIELSKGGGSVVLEKTGGDWVVASAFGYPADTSQVDKVLESLKAIEDGKEVGETTASHEEFEVDDKKGAVLRLYDSTGKVLSKLVVGTNAKGYGISSNHVFVRFGDEGSTYDVESDIRSDARLYSETLESKSFLLKEIFKLPEKEKDDEKSYATEYTKEIETVRLVRPDQPDLIVERRTREIPEEKPAVTEEGAEEPAQEPTTKKETYYVVTSGSEVHEVGKDEEWTARSFVDRGQTIRIEDAAEPKDLSEYGLDAPQLKAILSYREKDDPDAPLERLTLLFGNEKKDEKGSTAGYYFAIDDPAYRGRVYVIQDYTFDSWKKELKDFLPKPKEEPKAEETESLEEPAASETEAPAADTEASPEPPPPDGEAATGEAAASEAAASEAAASEESATSSEASAESPAQGAPDPSETTESAESGVEPLEEATREDE